MKGQPYLRKKGKKWIIEQKVEGKTKYIMTLPPLEEIITRHAQEKEIASQFYKEKQIKIMRRHADYKEIASSLNTQTKIKGAVNNQRANLPNKYDGFWNQFVVPHVKRIKGSQCESCMSTEHLVVHHLDYDNQTIDTLMVLCNGCHKALHDQEKYLEAKQKQGESK